MVPHLKNSLHLVVEGKTILYHLSFLSWDQKYSLGSSLENKIGERNHSIKILSLDRGSLTLSRVVLIPILQSVLVEGKGQFCKILYLL